MSVHTAFFKESHKSLGVFYPMHYLVAVYSDLPTAQKVRQQLLHANFRESEIMAVSGRDFIELEKEASGVIMRSLSRFFKTEQLSTDHNLELAEHSAGFVFVHCPSEKSKLKAWEIAEAGGPVTAHYYDGIGIDELAGGYSTD